MLMILVTCTIVLLSEAVGAAKYVGCFGDTNNKNMPGVTISYNGLKKCIKFCMSDNYRPSKYRKGCYCGESFGQGPLPEGRCYAYCPGTSAEECVGKYTDSVWYTGEKEKEKEGSESTEAASTETVELSGSGQIVKILELLITERNAQAYEETIYLGGWEVEEEEE